MTRNNKLVVPEFGTIFEVHSANFSILYYQDVDSLVYWANQAAYHWGLRGIAIWSLGQEDLRLWEALPKQTDTS